MTVGILAYGSLISDPGQEIKDARIATKKDIKTPFNVEYARSSGMREGAPTLVPVEEGVSVNAQIFVLNVDETEAANRLYRREIHKVGSGREYEPKESPGKNTVVVKCVRNFEGIDTVLYTKIAATIDPLTPENLARLAIESTKEQTDGKDGITYLMDAKRHGIKTRLSPEYEQEILRQLGVEKLKDALAAARSA
ncbi:hypothetical protein [Labrenzia sp. DG1229]|uniref:hypothetical protein n=1 Tax=Labrenzia sp. DG1229 TaxID=681847 RepID=UPI0004908ED2|nr:hypothetical protein [Labrenzia sp. DG1229]